MKNKKALVLTSGGLDSLLAIKLLLLSNIQVTGLVFRSCFFGTKKAEKGCVRLNIDCIIKDISKEHLEIVKNPVFGKGKGINPCIDCHLLMLKKAKKIKKEKNFDFVTTGEVLGQRPFSQNKKALEILKDQSNLNGYLVRPLSAKLLDKTIPEKKGWIDKKNLLDIQGRSRSRQMYLAEKYQIQYPQPAGGCILTDLHFANELKDMFLKWPNCKCEDINLLKLGRHFWKRKTLITLGRDEKENKRLEIIKKEKDIFVVPKNFPGPSALLRNPVSKVISKDVQKAQKLILKYSKENKIKAEPKFK